MIGLLTFVLLFVAGATMTVGVLGAIDVRLARLGTVPDWYGPLRRLLTSVVTLCLLVLLANRYWRNGLA